MNYISLQSRARSWTIVLKKSHVCVNTLCVMLESAMWNWMLKILVSKVCNRDKEDSFFLETLFFFLRKRTTEVICITLTSQWTKVCPETSASYKSEMLSHRFREGADFCNNTTVFCDPGYDHRNQKKLPRDVGVFLMSFPYMYLSAAVL